MSGSNSDFSMSTLSLHSNGSQNEDWDQSETDIQAGTESSSHKQTTTPRNSVVFPAETSETPGRGGPISKGERTISHLMRLHAEKGSKGSLSAEEALRVAEVLGQWINSESSPYEAEDDFFVRSQDDSSLASRRSPASPFDPHGRPRGQSECIISTRPSSAAGAIRT